MGNTLPMAGHRDIEIGMVLAPAFGEKGAFTPLGMAYLNGALREAGYTPTYVDLGLTMRSEDPDLHGELVTHGFSPDVGGFFGPELDLRPDGVVDVGRALVEALEPRLLRRGPLRRARISQGTSPRVAAVTARAWPRYAPSSLSPRPAQRRAPPPPHRRHIAAPPPHRRHSMTCGSPAR